MTLVITIHNNAAHLNTNRQLTVSEMCVFSGKQGKFFFNISLLLLLILYDLQNTVN